MDFLIQQLTAHCRLITKRLYISPWRSPSARYARPQPFIYGTSAI